MLSKKKFLTLSLICSLALSSFSIVASAESTESSNSSYSVYDMKKEEDFRKAYGFPLSTEKKLLNSNNESYQKFGVRLTDEEFETLKERDKTILDARKKQKEIMELYGASIGGIYYDHLKDNGVLRIGIVNNTDFENTKNGIVNILSPEDTIEFYPVERSKFALEQLQLEISNYLISSPLNYEFSSSDLSLPGNKVIITLKNITPKQSDDINQKYGQYITLEETESGLTAAETEGGAGITNNSDYGGCSNGFSAYSGSSYYLITAGHCGDVGDTFNEGNTYLGQVTQNLFVAGPTATDALKISTSDSKISYNIQGVNATITGYETSDLEVIGETICKKGTVTGLTCGQLQSTTKLYSLLDYPDILMTGGRQFNGYSKAGDSGGTIFSYWDQGLGRALVSGILSGRDQAGTYIIYAPASKILSNLGVQLYEW